MRIRLVTGLALAAAVTLVIIGLTWTGDRPTPRPTTPHRPPAAPEPGAADTPETASGPAVLAGIVVAHNGSPVSGAEVVALTLGDDLWPVDPEHPTPATRATDATGRFAFARLRPGDHMLRARAGERVGYLPLVRIASTGRQDVVLRLLETAAIEGRVLDTRSSPIAGATVTTDLSAVMRPYYEVLGVPPPPLEERFEARTDSGGRFRIGLLPRGPYDLLASGPEMNDRVFFAVEAPVDGVELMLFPARSIRGTVTWPGDAHPDEIHVRAEPSGTSTTVTPQGVQAPFRLDGLVCGTHEIRASAVGLADACARVEIVPALVLDPVHLSLSPGTPVEGTVKTRSGDPLPGAEVVVSRRTETEKTEVRRTTCGPHGRYRVVLGPGTYMVAAEANGYRALPLWNDRTFGGWTSGDILRQPPADDVLKVGSSPLTRDLVLVREHRIRGQVRRRNGDPAAWVKLCLSFDPIKPPEGRDPEWWWRSRNDFTMTDRRGLYRFEGLRAGYRYRVTHGEHEVVFEENQTEIVVNLTTDSPRGATVRGRVVDEDRKGIPGAIVFLPDPIETGPDGRFEKRRVPVWLGHLRTLALGYALGRAVKLDLADERVVTLPDIVLRRRGIVVGGLIVDARKQPVAGAHVSLAYATETDPHAVTAPDGRFELRGPGVWERGRAIVVRAVGHPVVTVGFPRPPAASLTIVLPDTGTIRGRFPDGDPPPGFVSVALRDRRNRWSSWRLVDARLTDGGRRFEASGLDPGRYLVRVLLAGCVGVEFDDKEVGGSPLDLGEIPLEPAGSIAGILIGVQNRTRARAVMLADIELSAAIGRDGRFRIDHVPPGAGTLGPASWRRTLDPSLTVNVVAGRTTTVELVVSR